VYGVLDSGGVTFHKTVSLILGFYTSYTVLRNYWFFGLCPSSSVLETG
jgi:hypothetical protein